MVQSRHWSTTSAFAVPALRVVQPGSRELDDDVREEPAAVTQNSTTAAASSVDPSLNAELIAMRAVGEALAQLDDSDARTRVMRWAMDRFCHEAPTAVSTEPVTGPAGPLVPMYPPIEPEHVNSCADNDPQLSVADLDTFFEEPHPQPSGSGLEIVFEESAPTSKGQVHPVDDEFCESSPIEDESRPIETDHPQQPPVAPAVAVKAVARSPKPPIHVMLQDLITQFRDLANEWEFASVDR